jgi:hypothetical protein
LQARAQMPSTRSRKAGSATSPSPPSDSSVSSVNKLSKSRGSWRPRLQVIGFAVTVNGTSNGCHQPYLYLLPLAHLLN